MLLDDEEHQQETVENAQKEIKVYKERKSSFVGLPILFYGPPRSGKSHIATELTEELRSSYVEAYAGPRFQIM